MDSKSSSSNVDRKVENNEDNKNKILFIMQGYFLYSVKSLINMVKTKSETLATENKLQQGKEEAHRKLRITCDDILNEFKTSMDDSGVDHVKIIKKVFYVLKDNMVLLSNKDAKLFTIRNEEGKITSIIPGINLNLVYELMDESEKKKIWFYLYALFVSSVNLVYSNTPENKHKKSVLEMVDKLRKEMVVTSKDLGTDFIAFNVFMGISETDNGEINMDTLMSKDINIPGTEANAGFLGNLGLGNLMNLNSLGDEIKKFTDNDVNDTVDTLGELLGNDSDVKDVCSTMVKTVIDDLKNNGIENIFEIAQRVTSKLGGVISPEKMAKTAFKMGDLMENNKDKLKDLKDENGNPIGENLFKQFQSTFSMAKNMMPPTEDKTNNN
jgi:hypothetical protein